MHRIGNGNLRHVRINDLWLQERVKEGRTAVTRISGADNVADIMTEDASKGVRESLLQRTPLSFEMQQSEKQLRIHFPEVVPDHHCRAPPAGSS